MSGAAKGGRIERDCDPLSSVPVSQDWAQLHSYLLCCMGLVQEGDPGDEALRQRPGDTPCGWSLWAFGGFKVQALESGTPVLRRQLEVPGPSI